MRRGRLALLAAVLVVAVALAGLVVLSSSDEAPEPVPLEQTLIRLSDLPAGYSIGDDSGCGALTPEGRPPALDAILGMNFPPVCSIELQRPHRDQGPHSIVSAAVELPSVDTASQVMTVLPELGRRVIGTAIDLESEPYDFEDGAAIMEFRDVNTQEEGIVLGWRSGGRINLISVAGDAQPDILTFTRGLADVQQKRAGKAEPLKPQDTDDRTVALDRSDLGVQVYWLGLDFAPAGLTQMTLHEAFGPMPAGSSPGNKVKIDYRRADGDPRPDAGIHLAIWLPGDWNAFVGTELGDLSTQPPCGEPQVIQLSDRRIEIHAPGPETPRPPLAQPQVGTPPQDSSSGNPVSAAEVACPRNYVGLVSFSDAIVVINGINCFACGGRGGGYDSAAGIEAIGRALQKR